MQPNRTNSSRASAPARPAARCCAATGSRSRCSTSSIRASIRAWRTRPVKAVRLLGQDLVLFRDGAGRFGLLDRPARTAAPTSSFGRREDDGLRCPFHGWKFGVDGPCLETPAEPIGSQLCQRVRQRSYPVRSSRASLFAWLGAEGRPAGAAGVRLPSSRRRATASRSRACGTATGCRRSRSASTRRIRRSCTATCRTSLDGRRLRSPVPRRERRRRRRRALADDARDARVLPPRDPLRGGRRRPAAPDDAAADERRADPRARDPCGVSGDLRDPVVGDDHDHADARAGRRHAHLLVHLLHELRRPARQGRDARPAPGLRDACPTTRRSTAATTTGASIPKSSARAPTSAWARTTSTCTTSGRSRAWARSRTARASTSARATR